MSVSSALKGSYRPGVCVVIQRETDGKVLLFHRVGEPPEDGWQFPQGGIDTALDVVQEARRELREEIGTDAIKVLRVSSRSYCYDFPQAVLKDGYRGQCHIWILAQLLISEDSIHFEHTPAEFDGWQWVSAQEACDRIVAFKYDVYRLGLAELGLLADRI